MKDEKTEITVPRPTVPFGPVGVPVDQADADYLRSAAGNIEFARCLGSNLTATVTKLLRDAADAITQPAPRCHQCGPGYRIGDDGCRHTGAATLADHLRGLAADPHARAVLAKAFREAPLANAAEALHALAAGLDAGTILRPPTGGGQ